LKYFEITPKSVAYEAAVKYWSICSVWEKAVDDIAALLETDVCQYQIRFNAACLNISTLECLPVYIKRDFRKSGPGSYFALQNSRLNVKFLKIVERYGLYSCFDYNIAVILNTAWQKGEEVHFAPVNGRYFIKTERKIYRRNLVGLIERSKEEFLREWNQLNKEDRKVRRVL